MHSLKYYRTRPARWLRRTGYLFARIRADLGLGGGAPPVWLRDNPFLAKAGRAETRRLGLLLRLGVTVLVLAALLLGGLWLDRTYARPVARVLGFLFGMTFPAALFVILTFVHATLVSGARAAQAVSLADEARRGTLSDLLLTPLRRAEMLLAMGVAPARTALLVALAGLPFYLLLGQFGALTARDIGFLYLLFALVSYAPPVYAFPALAGGVMTPETALGKFSLSGARRPARSNASTTVGLSILFSVFFLGQVLGLLRGGWLGHLLTALHLHLSSGFSFFLAFAWPAYAVQVLGARLDFFHFSLSPLLYGLPLLLCWWAASALQSASALSAGDALDMARLPIASRARTLARWTARAAGLCALGIVWHAWVESGDTATLAGGPFGAPGWDAAGLLLLLGGLTLPTVCARALETSPARKANAEDPGAEDPGAEDPSKNAALRSPLLVLRRAFKRAARPLGVAGALFLLACALGGLSPFASPVYQVAGKLALAGAATIVWAVGVRRVMPTGNKILANALLYVLPIAALSVPVPGASWLAALSPATAWLRLFPDAPGLLTHIQAWHIAAPPSFAACLAGLVLVGVASYPVARVSRSVPTLARHPSLGGKGFREEGLRGEARPAADAPATLVPPPSEGGVARLRDGVGRHAARTAVLMAWITARTDNPLFTHEIRTRTRSGRWVDWLVFGPLILLAAAIFGVAYPDILAALAATSPLHFFGNGTVTLGRYGIGRVSSDLAALLLALQCYSLGFRGQAIGEGLIARDRQRGIWGFLLLTPLTAREIFWGKVLGQSSAAGTIWAGCGLGGLLLYALTVPAVGLVPALTVWLVGQVFVAALFVLGLALGAALSSYPVFSKNLRGLAMLLFILVVGGGVAAQSWWLPFDQPTWGPLLGWSLLSARLLLGIGYAFALATPLLLFAQWRIADVRHRDVTVGDAE